MLCAVYSHEPRRLAPSMPRFARQGRAQQGHKGRARQYQISNFVCRPALHRCCARNKCEGAICTYMYIYIYIWRCVLTEASLLGRVGPMRWDPMRQDGHRVNAKCVGPSQRNPGEDKPGQALHGIACCGMAWRGLPRPGVPRARATKMNFVFHGCTKPGWEMLRMPSLSFRNM